MTIFSFSSRPSIELIPLHFRSSFVFDEFHPWQQKRTKSRFNRVGQTIANQCSSSWIPMNLIRDRSFLFFSHVVVVSLLSSSLQTHRTSSARWLPWPLIIVQRSSRQSSIDLEPTVAVISTSSFPMPKAIRSVKTFRRIWDSDKALRSTHKGPFDKYQLRAYLFIILGYAVIVAWLTAMPIFARKFDFSPEFRSKSTDAFVRPSSPTEGSRLHTDLSDQSEQRHNSWVDLSLQWRLRSERFDRCEKTVHSFVLFEKILFQFDELCNKTTLKLPHVIFFIGLILGSLVFGAVADHGGRKMVLLGKRWASRDEFLFILSPSGSMWTVFAMSIFQLLSEDYISYAFFMIFLGITIGAVHVIALPFVMEMVRRIDRWSLIISSSIVSRGNARDLRPSPSPQRLSPRFGPSVARRRNPKLENSAGRRDHSADPHGAALLVRRSIFFLRRRISSLGSAKNRCTGTRRRRISWPPFCRWSRSAGSTAWDSKKFSPMQKLFSMENDRKRPNVIFNRRCVSVRRSPKKFVSLSFCFAEDLKLLGQKYPDFNPAEADSLNNKNNSFSHRFMQAITGHHYQPTLSTFYPTDFLHSPILAVYLSVTCGLWWVRWSRFHLVFIFSRSTRSGWLVRWSNSVSIRRS